MVITVELLPITDDTNVKPKAKPKPKKKSGIKIITKRLNSSRLGLQLKLQRGRIKADRLL